MAAIYLNSPVAPFWVGFTAFDWVIAILLLWSTVTAFVRGAIREMVRLFGLVAGMLLASWNYERLSPILQPWLNSRPIADCSAFLLILSAVIVIVSLAGRLLYSGAHAIGLGLLDRLAGAALGLVRGVLAGVAIVTATTAFVPRQPAVTQSRLAPYLLAAAHGVSFVVPQQLKRQLTLGATTFMHTRAIWIKPLVRYDNQGQHPNQDPK